ARTLSMDQCRYCQGPIDQATGICRRCGQITPADQFEYSSPFSSNHAMYDGRCPRCGEETIPGQHFCRRCGLSLPLPGAHQEGQLVALPVGAQEHQAGGMTNGAYAFQASPGATTAWWESPTQPVITTSSDTSAASQARHR